MKRLVCAYAATLVATSSVALADPPAPPPDGTRCSVTTSSAVIKAGFDFSTMTGAVTFDGAAVTRRFKIKATPYAATYMLAFQGYGTGDHKPAQESLSAGKIVARIVAYGEVNHLFFDGDFHPTGLTAPMDGLVCQ